MTKIQIINIDIGQDIDEIIAGATTDLSEKGCRSFLPPRELDNARETKIYEVLEIVYNQLLMSTKENRAILLDELYGLTGDVFGNQSSFVQRMKTHLRKHHDNEMILKRCKIRGKTAYKLGQYNSSS